MACMEDSPPHTILLWKWSAISSWFTSVLLVSHLMFLPSWTVTKMIAQALSSVRKDNLGVFCAVLVNGLNSSLQDLPRMH